MALFDAHKNFAVSLVATAPSPASSGTSLVVTGGDGTKFPPTPFNATIWPINSQPTAANAEIVRVTNIATDTFTITRTQESTSARTVIIGDQIMAGHTVKMMTDLEALATGTSTVSTTGNITALPLPTGSGALVITMTNASLSTIQGITAGLDGQSLTLISTGAGQVDLSHQDAGASASLRLINFATSSKTSLAAGSGIARLVYDLANTRWRLIEHEQGAWITPTFSAGNYVGSGGSWTVAGGNVTSQAYMLRGRTLTVVWYIAGTSVTSSSSLIIGNGTWGSFVAAKTILNSSFGNNNGGGNESGAAQVASGGTTVQLLRLAAAPWSNATGATNVFGEIAFEVA